jgi:2-keto-4-pentenoate hydratase
MALTRGEVGRKIFDEHRGGTQFHTLAAECGVVDLSSAYAVQREYVALLHAARGAAAGYKIGLTSPRMQKMCNIDQPIAGVVFADRVARSGVALKTGEYGRMGVEFEIAVRLARDLSAAGAPYDAETVGRAVDGVAAAVEVVDDRNADYKSLDVLSLIADNSWNAGAILDAFRTSWPDLSGVRGVLSIDGKEVDSGHGRDVLGHPFVPLAWLANRLIADGSGLKAGDIVLTGSLVTTKFPKEPGRYRYELAGIGAVDFSVEM